MTLNRTEVEIRNYFHGTRASARPDARNQSHLWLSGRQVKRIRRELCGMADCCCGGLIGERAGNNNEPAIVTHDGQVLSATPEGARLQGWGSGRVALEYTGDEARQ